MNEVGKEYGASLYMLGVEENLVDTFSKDITLVYDVFRSEGEYLEFLSSPNISMKARLDAINEAFFEKVHEYVLSFVQLMCEKGRLDSFFEAFDTFFDLVEQANRVMSVRVKSAVELLDDEKRRLEEKLEKKSGCRVRAEYIVDKSLIGGVVVETDDSVIDGSLRYKLQQVKEVISK